MVFLNRANLHSDSSIILSMAIVVRSTFNSIALADGRSKAENWCNGFGCFSLSSFYYLFFKTERRVGAEQVASARHAARLPSKLLEFMELVQCFNAVSTKISTQFRVMQRTRLLPTIVWVVASLRKQHRKLPVQFMVSVEGLFRDTMWFFDDANEHPPQDNHRKVRRMVCIDISFDTKHQLIRSYLLGALISLYVALGRKQSASMILNFLLKESL